MRRLEGGRDAGGRGAGRNQPLDVVPLGQTQVHAVRGSAAGATL